MPTTVTKTIKASGGDYTSLAAWEAAQQGDLVTADEVRQAECYGFSDTTRVTIDGSTTDATRYLRVYAAAGAEAQMPYDTTGAAYRLECSFGGGEVSLRVFDNYTRIERIQVKATPASQDGSFGYDAINMGGSVGVRIVGCYVLGNYTSWSAGSTRATGITEGNDVNGSNYIVNNVVDGFDYPTHGNASGIFVASHAYGSTPQTYISNNTVVRCGNGFRSDAASTNYDAYTLRNNLVAQCATDFSGLVDAASDYNASEDATAPGTHSRTSQTFTFAGTGDYHLASSDAGAKDYGTDLSADSGYAFSTDFDGDTRSGTWDIGADEYASSSIEAEVATASWTVPRAVLAVAAAAAAATWVVPRATVGIPASAAAATWTVPQATVGVSAGAATATWHVPAPTLGVPAAPAFATWVVPDASVGGITGAAAIATWTVPPATLAVPATPASAAWVTPAATLAVPASAASGAWVVPTATLAVGAASASAAWVVPAASLGNNGVPGPHPLTVAYGGLTKTVAYGALTKTITWG